MPSPKLNLAIPGQMTENELKALSALAARVPSGGVIVEAGSLYGLSSWHWAQNSADGVEVHCIDPWKRAPWIVETVERPQNAPPFSRSAFEHYVSACSGIILHEGYSPQICAGWTRPIDIYFDDAVHVNPVLRMNLLFWQGFVKPGGHVCGHDYRPVWPHVIAAAEHLARKWKTRVERVETFWWVRKP